MAVGTLPVVESNIEGRGPAMPSSFGGSIELLDGLRALVKDQRAAAQELHNAAKEIRISVQRNVQFSSGVNQVQQRAVRDAVESVVSDMAPGEPIRPGPGQVSPASEGRLARARSRSPEGGAPPERQPYEFEGAWHRGSGYSVSSLRQDLAKGIQRRLSEWPVPGFQQTDEGYYRVDRHGAKTPLAPVSFPSLSGGSTGPVALAEEGGQPVAPSVFRGIKTMSAAKEVLGGIASGESVGSSIGAVLPTGLMKAAGIAGAGVALAREGLSFAENQREQNAQWQSFRGGSNFEQFRERAGQRMFQFSTMGVMGAGQSAELYRGVAEQGLRGADRSQAMDFGLNMYKQLGMRVSDSMDIINEASKTGQESLTGVAKALKDVTESAKDAGVNTELARKQWVQSWKTLNTTLGAGPGTTELAGALQNQVSSLGRWAQDINPSQMLSGMQQYVVGAQYGVTAGDMVKMANGAPGQRQQVANMIQGNVQGTAERMFTGAGVQAIRNYAETNKKNALGPNGKFNETQQREAMMAAIQADPNFDPTSFLMAAQVQTGIQFESWEDAALYLTNAVTGDLNIAGDMQKQQQQRAQESRSFDDDKRLGQGERDSGLVGKQIGVKGVRKGMTDAEVKAMVGGKNARMKGEYLSRYSKTVERSGTIEKLLRTDNNAKRKYRVTLGGEERILSGEDLLKYAPDQAARGDVQIVEGRDAGKTLAEALDVDVNKKVAINSVGDKSLAGKGKSAKDFDEKHQHDTGGTVVVSPSPELQRWLRFQASGHVSVSDSYSPPPGHVTPTARNAP